MQTVMLICPLCLSSTAPQLPVVFLKQKQSVIQRGEKNVTKKFLLTWVRFFKHWKDYENLHVFIVLGFQLLTLISSLRQGIAH